MEELALGKETDSASAERLGAVEAELADLVEQRTAMQAHWQNEKDAIDRIRGLKEQEDTLRRALDRETDLEKAAEIRYGQLPGIEKQVEEASAALSELQAEKTMLKEEVDEEDIAEAVSYTHLTLPTILLV